MASSRSFSSVAIIRMRRTLELLHRVLIDVIGDRLAYAVADLDCARVVHAAPDSGVVTVRARLRDAGVRAVRLTGGRQRKSLLWSEVTEENGRSGTIEAGVPGRIFRVRRSVDERQPGRIGSRIRIAVSFRERDRSHRPPCHFHRNGAVESLGAPDRERRVGHRDVQHREKPVAGRKGQMVGARNLVRSLIPMDAGISFPKRGQRRLFLCARRSGPAAERLDGVEIGRVPGPSDSAAVQAGIGCC